MNPPRFSVSSTIEDPKIYVKDFKKVFNVMHMLDLERVELAAYQLKNVARIWFDHWKKNRDQDAPHLSWACF